MADAFTSGGSMSSLAAAAVAVADIPAAGDGSASAWTRSLAREVDDARRLLDYAVGKGLAVPDTSIGDIETASAWQWPPTVAQRVAFELAYRDLVHSLSPVTADTLRATSDDPADGRTVWLLARHPVSEAKIWSRKLGAYAGGVLALILFSENLTGLLTVDESALRDGTTGMELLSYTMQSLEPFLYGALGSVTYLLKSAHSFIYERTFDRMRIPEYYNRLLLGLIAGGAVKLFVTEVATDDGQVAELSGAALAFIAGYNSEFLFSAIERITAAILPKVGVDSIRRAGPDGQTTVLVQQLLERLKTADGTEQKTIDRILDRLVR